ncbi:MAG: HEAT repeat domain-containing protein [Streptosporangiaceae bacterium]
MTRPRCLLRDRATTDENWDVRRAAAEALAAGWAHDPATAEILHDRATTRQHEVIRRAAAQGLAGSGVHDHPPAT